MEKIPKHNLRVRQIDGLRAETTQREEGRKIDSEGDSSVRDVATCHRFSPLLLKMHHQSLVREHDLQYHHHSQRQTHHPKQKGVF